MNSQRSSALRQRSAAACAGRKMPCCRPPPVIRTAVSRPARPALAQVQRETRAARAGQTHEAALHAEHLRTQELQRLLQEHEDAMSDADATLQQRASIMSELREEARRHAAEAAQAEALARAHAEEHGAIRVVHGSEVHGG